MTTQATASPRVESRRTPPRASSAATADATATSAPKNTDALARLLASQPATLSGEKGGPRLVAYQGRNAAITTRTPESIPT